MLATNKRFTACKITYFCEQENVSNCVKAPVFFPNLRHMHLVVIYWPEIQFVFSYSLSADLLRG